MGLFGPPDVEKMRARNNIKGLIKALQYKKDSGVRTQAARALGEVGDSEAAKWLLVACEDEDFLVRIQAHEALVKIGEAAVVPIIEDLGTFGLSSKPFTSFTFKIKILGKIGGHRAVNTLINTLKSDKLRLREAVVEALGETGDARAVKPLITAALKDNDMENKVLKLATVAIGKIGDPGAVDPFINALKDKDFLVRKNAVIALHRLGDPKAVGPLIGALKDTDSRVRKGAADALKELGWKPNDRETEAWYWVARKEWEKAINLGSEAVEPLIIALKDENSFVSDKAAEALGEIGDKRAVEPLVAFALQDKGVNVNTYAVRSLGKIGDTGAVEPFITALKEGDKEQSWKSWVLRVKAAEALGEIGDARAVEPLIDALSEDLDYRFEVRLSAAKALERLYRNSLIDEQTKKLILSVRSRITAIHADNTFCEDGDMDNKGIGKDSPYEK